VPWIDECVMFDMIYYTGHSDHAIATLYKQQLRGHLC
jgi:hypothetical protein